MTAFPIEELGAEKVTKTNEDLSKNNPWSLVIRIPSLTAEQEIEGAFGRALFDVPSLVCVAR